MGPSFLIPISLKIKNDGVHLTAAGYHLLLSTITEKNAATRYPLPRPTGRQLCSSEYDPYSHMAVGMPEVLGD